MNKTNEHAQANEAATEFSYHDVIIVGAGLSGIGAAVHLKRECPGRDVILLERRQAVGGTWDLFRYPGIRSDSDMYTLGYDFKPWLAQKSIADGPSIRAYVNETADEYGIRDQIRFGHQLQAANWSSREGCWQLTVMTGEGPRHYRCQFLLMCSGYYSYDKAYQPEFPGQNNFKGTWVQPQFWPESLDFTNKRVVVIGSGATAVTLVPSMASTAASVTMLQRSPSYVITAPEVSRFAHALQAILPSQWAYDLMRWRNVLFQQWLYGLSRMAPKFLRWLLLSKVRKALGDSLDVDKHFTPRYDPWDQRLCAIPDDDLFKAIRSGKATVVTDHIARITESGILLQSGEVLEADIIVAATGLELVILGGASFTLDHQPIDFAATWTYKGMMCSDIPNMVHTFGYINASWTLRADLIARWFCRLLRHMEGTATNTVTPRMTDELAASMPRRLWIDDFSAGYMQRALPRFPKQGDRAPWINPQHYRRDRALFRDAPIDDGTLEFSV